MAGLVFPDLVGTLSRVAGMEHAQAQRDFMDEDRKAKASASPFVAKALQGDPAAINEVATRHPETAMKLAPLLERLDAGQRARAKEASEYTVQTGMAILNAPPDQQPQLYAQARQDAQARGLDVSRWPTQYNPGWVKFNVDKAMPFAEHFKRSGEGVTYVDGGGGTAPTAPTNVPGNSRETGQQFLSYLTTKHNLPPVAAAGVVGGLFQESGFNPNAVGDNGTAGGLGQWRLDRRENLARFAQAQGKPVNDPYVQLDYLVSEMKGGDMGAQRAYAMLQQAKTPEEATTAMMHFFRPAGYTPNNPQGGHGYAQRVQYAQQFAPQPVGREVSTGGNAAPMPQPPAGLTPPGPPPAQMPNGPPGLAQGSDMPRADASGTPLAPGAAIPIETLKGVQLPPGYKIGTQGGKIFSPVPGYVQVMPPSGGAPILWPVPKVKEPGPDKGLFGDSLTGRALNALRTLTPETQEYAAAYAILSKPQVVFDQQTGQQRVIQPMDLSMFPRPAFAGGATPAAAPPVDGATTAQILGGGTVTTTPGKGKPLDNSARDDLTKASGGVLELGELVKSFDPSFGGYRVDALGESANFAKRNLPDFLGGADEKGQAQWWQRYSMFANLERNKLFGSALTPGETAAFNAAMVSPGMKPDQIRINLERQRDIASKALSRIVNSMVESGYNAGAIEAATGIKIGELPSPMGGTPQAPTADKGKQQFDLKKKYGLE